MKINYLQESYFKDVTVKKEDNRTNVEKLAQSSRDVMQKAIKVFTNDWFVKKGLDNLQGEQLSFVKLNTKDDSECLPGNLIDHIDFDNKTIYINVIITRNLNDNNRSFGNYLNYTFDSYNSNDKSVIIYMDLFEYDFREKFKGFSVKYLPSVRDSIYDDTPRPSKLNITFGNLLSESEYSYIYSFFRRFEDLSIAVLRFSMYDDNFYKFYKDFKFNDRLINNIDCIKIYWNNTLPDTAAGIPIGIIKNRKDADDFTKEIKARVKSITNYLENGPFTDVDQERDSRKMLPICIKLSRINFARMIRQ